MEIRLGSAWDCKKKNPFPSSFAFPSFSLLFLFGGHHSF
jgi:hypothetical protein